MPQDQWQKALRHTAAALNQNPSRKTKSSVEIVSHFSAPHDMYTPTARIHKDDTLLLNRHGEGAGFYWSERSARKAV
jgi:hypothetical protein